VAGSLSDEFERRRSEACDRISQIVDEYHDVFGPHALDPDDDTPVEITADGQWLVTAWALTLGYLRVDDGRNPDEFVRVVSPRNVSYPTRVGLLSIGLDTVA
jgi:hypothetical protein